MPERVDKQINFVIIFILLGSVAGMGWDGWAGSFGNRGGMVMQFNRNRAFFIFLFYSLDHKQAMIRTGQFLGLKELFGIYIYFHVAKCG